MQASILQYNGPAIPANSNPQADAIPILDDEGNVSANGANIGGLTETETIELTGVASPSTSGTVSAETSVERVNASGGAVTRTLPPAATVTGQVIALKKIDSSGNLVTVSGNGGTETIDGATTYTGLSAQWKSVVLYSNGVSWDILATH